MPNRAFPPQDDEGPELHFTMEGWKFLKCMTHAWTKCPRSWCRRQRSCDDQDCPVPLPEQFTDQQAVDDFERLAQDWIKPPTA